MAREGREPQAGAMSDEKDTNYELFVAALAILAVINLGIIVFASDPTVVRIAVIIDLPLTAVFLGDFSYRLATAGSRHDYFFRQFGWADLLASVPLPQFNLLRLFRVWRVARIVRRNGGHGLLRAFLQNRAGGTLLAVLFLLLLVVEFGAMFVYLADRASPDANITSASDAVWWAYITVTTIGYGDRYPVTSAGRVWALAVAATGVGLFGVLTGYLANAFLAPPRAVADRGDDGGGRRHRTPAGPGDGPSEIARLLAEQRQAQAEILARLTVLERLLTTQPTQDAAQGPHPEPDPSLAATIQASTSAGDS